MHLEAKRKAEKHQILKLLVIQQIKFDKTTLISWVKYNRTIKMHIGIKFYQKK